MEKALLALALCLLPWPLLAAEDFYRGKTIRVIVGGSAGGGFDLSLIHI